MTDLKTDTTVETDLKIEKVISRGEGVNAQVLLVLVSAARPAKPDDDIWVALDRTEPTEIPADDQGSVEAARPLTMAELRSLDLGCGDDNPPFALEDSDTRSHWLARFDFSDHLRLAWQWSQLAQGREKGQEKPLSVVAWRTRSQVKHHMVAGKTEYYDSFVALPAPAKHSVPLSEVVAQPLFELGVLFVHGIGNHHVRETLVRWAEPIVKLWRERGFTLEEQADRIPAGSRQRVSRWAASHQLRTRIPIDGISQVVEDFAPRRPTQSPEQPVVPLEALVRPVGEPPAICCVASRTEETTFADSTPGMPSSAVLRLSTVDTNGVLREAHVLFAEAYWSRESFTPAWSELRYWLTTAIPIGVWARMERLFVTRLAEIWKFAQGAYETRDGYEVFRVLVSTVLWVFQAATLPTVYILGAVAAQILLAISSLVRLVPIPWLQRGIRAVITTLMGTLGQSFALQNSPIRRAAIVSAVTNNLNWLGDRSQKVVVLSHSQGAEIARRVFLDARRDSVAQWYTFGAGITPLNMLHPRILEKPSVKTVVFANKLVLMLVGTLLVSLALDFIPGVRMGTRNLLAQGFRQTHWGWFVLAYAIFLRVVGTLARRVRPPVHKMNLRRSLLRKWTDFFASEDPVPGGSFVDRNEKELGAFNVQQRRVFNTRVSALDHTCYWQNIEEFVAPIALDMLHLLGMGGDRASECDALKCAARRRDRRTWWNIYLSVIGLVACAISVLWTAFGPAHRSAVWAEQARVAWSQGSGILKRVPPFWNGGFFGQLITDLWLPFVILMVLGAWWGVNQWLRRWSEKALIRDLADAARSGVPR